MSKRALAVALSLFCLIGLSVCSMTMYGIFQHERSLSAYSKSIGTENSQSIHAGIWLKESEGLLNIMTNMENFRTKITNDNSSTKVVLSDKNYFKTEMIKEIIGEEKLHIYAKLQRNINNDSDVVFNDQVSTLHIVLKLALWKSSNYEKCSLKWILFFTIQVNKFFI